MRRLVENLLPTAMVVKLGAQCVASCLPEFACGKVKWYGKALALVKQASDPSLSVLLKGGLR